ncbi:MAG: zinc-binding dehydrogenase [Actinomycetota bacterium]
MSGDTNLELRSTVGADGTLRLTLEESPVPQPGPDEVVIRVGAAPINPSDLGVLLAAADPASLAADATGTTGTISPSVLGMFAGRFDQPTPVGNEGAGTVVATGSAADAAALEGKVVAVIAGGMYSRYRTVRAADCLVMADGTTAEQAASAFVNPLTVLGMIETMRREGHTAIVHTVGASNLGHMLRRACAIDGVPLVEIVRRPEHVATLRDLGAEHVCDSSADSFRDDLDAALTATGATIAFDAIGGGEMVDELLASMERAASAGTAGYSRYGSTTHKQVYVYGGLDRGPTTLRRTYGMAWSVGGWLMPNFLAAVGHDRAEELRRRVADEITTTFASDYSSTISLQEAIEPDTVRRYARMATGDKFLITPDGS